MILTLTCSFKLTSLRAVSLAWHLGRYLSENWSSEPRLPFWMR